jgi:hypothetical protein
MEGPMSAGARLQELGIELPEAEPRFGIAVDIELVAEAVRSGP